MTCVNKKILLSLKHDLTNLNNINKNILSKVKSFELNSWLYPTKQFWEVSNTEIAVLPESVQYSTLLEFLIDRLYLTMHLIINFVDDFPNVKVQDRYQQNVKRNKLSLGTSIELLWKKLKYLKQNYSSGIKNLPQTIIQDQFTQTNSEFSSFRLTEYSNKYFIQKLVEELRPYPQFKNVEAVRRQIQQDLFDLTQKECVNRITTCIIDDLKKCAHRFRNSDERIQKLQSKADEETRKYEELLKVNESVSFSLHKFKDMYILENKRNHQLIDEIVVLSNAEKTQNKAIDDYKNKISSLERQLQNATTVLDVINSDKDALHQSVEGLQMQNSKLYEEVNLWKCKFSDSYLENRNLKLKLKCRKEILAISITMEEVDSRYKDFSRKLELLNNRIEENTENLMNFYKPIVDVVERQKIKEVGKKDVSLWRTSSFIDCSVFIVRGLSENKRNHQLIDEIVVLSNAEKTQNKAIDDYKNKISSLERQLQNATTVLDVINSDKDALHQSVEGLQMQNSKLYEEVNLWKCKFSDSYLENRNLKLKLKCRKEILAISITMEEVDSRYKDFSRKLELLNNRIEENTENLMNFYKPIVVRRIMVFADIHNIFIVEAYFQSGTRAERGVWYYSYENCYEQFHQIYPDLDFMYNTFIQHVD
ncbi:hypothetical protein FQA39_LY02643 [Lamprigera yunnana]|nr:hypothetical protein FQA39_LY02643 [Lamprigera yunnana]